MIHSLNALARAVQLAGARLSLCGVVLVITASAHASPNYPAILDKHFGVTCPRPLTRCLICHTTAAGGIGTAKQVFALALLNDDGLSGGKDGRSLAEALDRIPADTDSDGDGTPDLDELAKCGNPSGPDLSEGPGFGCALGSGSARHSGFDPALALLAVSPVIAIGFLRRRRRHARG